MATALENVGSPSARILCIGDDVEYLLGIQYQLDNSLDVVIVCGADEGNAALLAEGAFDVIINVQHMRGLEGALFDARLRAHSPDAERLVLVPREDEATRAMVANDGRVMRLLETPCAAQELRQCVSDALLRHRARAMRAAAVPHVTPTAAHPCCVSA